jgi:transcriptional regulator GlxA family with amidase domain
VRVVAARLFAWGARALLLDNEEFLMQRAIVRKYEPVLIRTAAKFLQHSKGQYRITELADYCQVSTRQLERGFNQVIGTTPKTFARTVRFEQAQRRVRFDPDVSLTELAYECGYFDQAHFIKTSRRSPGLPRANTPRACARCRTF